MYVRFHHADGQNPSARHVHEHNLSDPPSIVNAFQPHEAPLGNRIDDTSEVGAGLDRGHWLATSPSFLQTFVASSRLQ